MTITPAAQGLPQDTIYQTLDLDSDEFRNNWFEHVTQWVIQPPFYNRNPSGSISVICGRPDDVRDVQMDDGDRFSLAFPKNAGHESFDFFMGLINVANLDGEDHQRIRRLLAKPFSRASFKSFEPEIQIIITKMVDAVEEKTQNGGEFDAMSDFCSHLIAKVVLEGMLGFEEDQLLAFYQMNDALALTSTMKPGDPFPDEYIAAFNGAYQAVKTLIDRRREFPSADFISAMVHARDGEDKLSEEELIGNIFAISAAALTTTAISMGMGLYHLCRHPEQLKQLQAELSLIPQALEECLRYQGPGFLSFPRYTLRDTEIGGLPVKQGMVVEISQTAVNFCPVKYENPLDFDINRSAKGTATFGAGPHTCVGNHIAKTIMKMALQELLSRFPDLRLAESDFVPTFHGMHGELAPNKIPLRVD